MQQAIMALRALGVMPDSIKGNPSGALVDSYERLLGEVKTPLTQEEVMILISLFPEISMYEVEWSLLHLVETFLVENPAENAAYRQLISACPSQEWRETLLVRLDNWEREK